MGSRLSQGGALPWNWETQHWSHLPACCTFSLRHTSLPAWCSSAEVGEPFSPGPLLLSRFLGPCKAGPQPHEWLRHLWVIQIVRMTMALGVPRGWTHPPARRSWPAMASDYTHCVRPWGGEGAEVQVKGVALGTYGREAGGKPVNARCLAWLAVELLCLGRRKTPLHTEKRLFSFH